MLRRLLIGLLALLAAGCGPEDASTGTSREGSPDAPGSKSLTIGITQYPATLHPAIDPMLGKLYVLAMTMRPLTAFDHDWRLACSLCVTLPTLENGLAVLETTPEGEPGLAVTWEIPAGATWGDGVPVTSRDALFTWQVGKHPQSGIDAAEAYGTIEALEVLDDKRFTMHLNRRTPEYNAAGGLFLLPEHLERPVFESAPAEYRHRTKYDTDPTNPGLYFGPYRVVEAVHGSHVTLERNPTWYGRSPYFDRIVVRAIERTTTLEANLLSGSLDMIAGELGLQLDQAQAFERRHGDRFAVVYEHGLLYEHIDLNLDNPVLADRRVRQALLYALDREALDRQLFGGQQPVALTFVHPMDRPWTDAVAHYPFEPARAAALLDEAGWRLADDGMRRNPAGEPLRFEIVSTAGDKSRELVEQVLQSQWREAGIDLRIRNETPRVFFGDTLPRRAFEDMALYGIAATPEPVPRQTLHSSAIPSAANNFSGLNFPGFADAEVDRLIEALETELDPEARLPIWHRLQQIYADELPALPLFFRTNPYVLPRWLTGVRPTGHVTVTTNWIEEWARTE
ncbi:MAG TPA: peptide ABC transporter substrate-binding protein [Pseudomonadales bacterium]